MTRRRVCGANAGRQASTLRVLRGAGGLVVRGTLGRLASALFLPSLLACAVVAPLDEVNGAAAEGTGGQALDGQECDPPCSGSAPHCEAGVCVACQKDSAPRCGAGETPEECVGGQWVAQKSCGGNAPLCTNGTCANVRLAGGLVSVRAASASGSLLLVDHGFEVSAPLCKAVGGETVCVSGGVRP